MADALITIATRHQSHYERLKTHEANKFDKFLIEIDADIRRILSGDVTEYTRKRLEQVLKQVNVAMTRRYKEYRKVWEESVTNAAAYEAEFELKTLQKIIKDIEFAMPSATQIAAAVFNTPLGDIGGPSGGSLLESFFEEMTKAQVRKIEGAIRLGYAEGQTTPQIVRRIRGTKAGNFMDGLLATSKRDAEAITRTALQHAASQAREATWANNQSVIKSVKVVATLDSRTSPTCRSLDGKEFPVDKGPRPPFHINCRSTMVAVLKNKFAGLSKGRTRTARDPETGRVETVQNQTYYGWLRGQPASVQDSIIGPTRGKLLRDGGLTAERFSQLQLGKNFEPITLPEMRKLEPAAFDKAGL